MNLRKQCCCDAARARDEYAQSVGSVLFFFAGLGFLLGWLCHAHWG